MPSDEDRVPGEPALSLFRIRRKPAQEIVCESLDHADEDMHRLEQIARDDGHHHIQLELDGKVLPGNEIPLLSDGCQHQVYVLMI